MHYMLKQFKIFKAESSSRTRGLPITKPMFSFFIMMECNDYNKLLNIERRLHLAGHDTTFKLL